MNPETISQSVTPQSLTHQEIIGIAEAMTQFNS